MSNREYFLTYCVRQDLSAIYRYVMAELGSQFDEKPVWERDEILERWLEQPLNMSKWNEAKSRSSQQ